MGKLAILAVALVLLSTARCYNADLESSLGGVPVLGAMINPPVAAPAYVSSIGKAAPITLPESDPKAWFGLAAAAAEGATPDAYDVPRWRDVAAVAEIAGTQAGWAEVCKKVSTAAGAERTAEPKLGALACSANGTVTAIQRAAIGLLAMQAQVALYLRGVPGASIAAIGARQGELRVTCDVDVIGRLGGPETPYGQACGRALETDYLTGEATKTFAALDAAYTALAAEIARLDPKTAAEPGYFEAAKK